MIEHSQFSQFLRNLFTTDIGRVDKDMFSIAHWVNVKRSSILSFMLFIYSFSTF